MAADVRKDDHSEIESCSISASNDGFDTSFQSSIESLPSDAIVQKQMQDIILAQKAAVEQLVKNNIDVLNASRASFNTTVQSQEEKIKLLEKTLAEEYVPLQMYELLEADMKENYVPKEKHDILQTHLEQECERHSATQNKLDEVLDKLDDTLSQLAAVKCEMENNKAAFSEACDTLKEEISEAHAKNKDLESKLHDKTLLCERQKAQILEQHREIDTLYQKQQQQMLRYQQRVTETEVEKQQEAYLNKMFNDINKKKR